MSALFYGRAWDQMGQKGRYLAKNVSLGCSDSRREKVSLHGKIHLIQTAKQKRTNDMWMCNKALQGMFCYCLLLVAGQKALHAKSGGNWLQMILNDSLMVPSVKKGADENVMRQDNWRLVKVVFKMSLIKYPIYIQTNLFVVPF